MVCFQGARGSGTRRWQIHRCLAVSVPLLRAWVHFPRAPEQFVASPLCLVGYVRWDARSDRVPPLQTIIFSSFTGRTPVIRLHVQVAPLRLITLWRDSKAFCFDRGSPSYTFGSQWQPQT